MSDLESPETTTRHIVMNSKDLLEFYFSRSPFEDWAASLPDVLEDVIGELSEPLWDTPDFEDGIDLSHALLRTQHDLHTDIVIPKCAEYTEELPEAGTQATLMHELIRGFVIDNLDLFQVYLAKLLKEYRDHTVKEEGTHVTA